MKCDRCGRYRHSAKNCFYRRDVHGARLPDRDEGVDSDSTIDSDTDYLGSDDSLSVHSDDTEYE